jgi:hypothetical protein
MALLVALSSSCTDLPALVLEGVGLGAGTKDVPGRANVTRVLVGTRTAPAAADGADPAVLLEANVDDLDPRLWPGVLASLLAAGAADAWLVPIVMKKGRPAHTLSVLSHPDRAERLREEMLTRTSTIGVRQHQLGKFALPRGWVDVALEHGEVAVKVAHRDGVVLQVSPEFDDVADYATAHDRPARLVLSEALQRAAAAGVAPGGPVPPTMRSTQR